MPHADSSFIPTEITTKVQFYAHIQEQLTALLEDSHFWVSNLAQTSSLLYHSYLSSPLYGFKNNGIEPCTPVVNWCGFYIRTSSFQNSTSPSPGNKDPLIVGPYNGRPACSVIHPIAGKGVCADAFLTGKPVVVENVDNYPGHIACDGETKSEIVVPLFKSLAVNGAITRTVIGVLDLDSTSLSTFDQDDVDGLEEVVRILEKSCSWE